MLSEDEVKAAPSNIKVADTKPKASEYKYTMSVSCLLYTSARVTSVFVSLRNKLRDDQKEIRHLQDRDQLTGLYNLEAVSYTHLDVYKRQQ